ncbi:hypothetical protein AZH53_09620 [Methanomicrobiaceae archaeon CYW5]|nr:hypothetical protein [Methanovulcanius yangii]
MYRILLILCLLSVLAFSCSAYSTEVTVRRYAIDGLTPINETTVSYEWMEENLEVWGDGNTYYYFQGPIFEGEWENEYGVSFPDYRDDWPGGVAPSWDDSEEKWDRIWNASTQSYEQNERTNWEGKNLGKLKGTNIADLCDLVGGLPEGKDAKVIAADNVNKVVPYSVLYENTSELGPYVLTWYSMDAGESGMTSGYTGPDYTNGMRATFFADTSRNVDGFHVAGLADMFDGMSEEYWYYYYSGGIQYPSLGGWTLKYVDRIYVSSNDPVPAPEAAFAANVKTGRITNGDFETGIVSPWTGTGVSIYTAYLPSTKTHGTYSAKLSAPSLGSASLEQEVDLTDVESIRFYTYYYGEPEVYMQVLVDDTVVGTFSSGDGEYYETEMIDISSLGFSGTHTLTFRAVSDLDDSGYTVYLDDIEDLALCTSGPAPLDLLFTDLSAKMEDSAYASWSWDFGDGNTSTEQHPLHTYTDVGTYTVTLTATNAAGSDTETKTGYIEVLPPAPVADFSASADVVVNGGFEDDLTGWTSAGVTADTSSQHSGIKSAQLQSTKGTPPSYLEQDLNLTGIDQLSYFYEVSAEGGVSRLDVSIDSTVEATYSSSTFPWSQETLDVSSYTGVHTLRFEAITGTNKKDTITANVDDVSALVVSSTGVTGSPPFEVSFTDTSTGDPTSWAWDFDTNGVVDSTLQNPVYTYNYPGLYTVSLTATNLGGSTTVTKTAFVNVSGTVTTPVADFTANPTTGSAPLPVSFTDTSTNNPTSWSWTFGDGESSTLQHPVHEYENEGTYTVTLTATNSAGSDTMTKTGYITVGSTTPSITVEATGDLTGWNLGTETDTVDSTSIDLSVSTTASTWEVRVSDTSANPHPGHMAAWLEGTGYVTDGAYLYNPLQVKAKESDAYVGANSNSVILDNGDGTGTYDIWLKQTTVAGDEQLASGVYRAEITFTGAVT